MTCMHTQRILAAVAIPAPFGDAANKYALCMVEGLDLPLGVGQQQAASRLQRTAAHKLPRWLSPGNG